MPTPRCYGLLAFLLPLAALLTACDPGSSVAQTRAGQASAPQSRVNLRLKHELDSIDVVDQQYRLLLMQPPGPATDRLHDSLARVARIPVGQVSSYIIGQMLQVDSANIRRIGQIIRQYGYPGKTLVGSPTNEVAILVIQHSNRIPRYLPLIEQVAQRGEAPYYLYARMLDRQLMYEGKEQLYGTQGRSYGVLNAQGQPETISLIWPIQDAAHVNERRKKAGFDSTVEANAQRLHIEYRPVTLDEVRRIEQRAAEASHH